MNNNAPIEIPETSFSIGDVIRLTENSSRTNVHYIVLDIIYSVFEHTWLLKYCDNQGKVFTDYLSECELIFVKGMEDTSW